MTKANIDCVDVLGQGVAALVSDPSSVLSIADRVEMLEESIDDLYGEVRRYFAEDEMLAFTSSELILMNQFFDAIETVADWCENTADLLRSIAVRRK